MRFSMRCRSIIRVQTFALLTSACCNSSWLERRRKSLSMGKPRLVMATAGLYLRLLRDEVLAEWQLDGPSPTLHVHCHMSGQERCLAPPHLRNYILKCEMALVRYGNAGNPQTVTSVPRMRSCSC